MPRARNPDLWYKDLEHLGIELTLKERPDSPNLQLAGRIRNDRLRRSMRTSNKKLAERRARKLMTEIAETIFEDPHEQNPVPSPPPTVGRIFEAYRTETLPHHKKRYRTELERAMDEFGAVVGTGLRIDELGQQHVDQFERVRVAEGPKLSTVCHELALVSVIFNWATRYKIGTEFLLDENPFHRLNLPSSDEDKAQTPLATHDRFEYTLRCAGCVDSTDLLFHLLGAIRYSGRRFKEVSRLRWGDVFSNPKMVGQILSQRGKSAAMAEKWPHGAIRWRAENHRKDRSSVVPTSPVLATILTRWRRVQGGGSADDWVFPAVSDAEKPVPYNTARKWLLEAEAHAREAGLAVPNQQGGTFHPYRRLWRSERAGRYHDKAIAEVAGWEYEERFTPEMNRNYFHVLAEKMYDVICASPDVDLGRRHTCSHSA